MATLEEIFADKNAKTKQLFAQQNKPARDIPSQPGQLDVILGLLNAAGTGAGNVAFDTLDPINQNLGGAPNTGQDLNSFVRQPDAVAGQSAAPRQEFDLAQLFGALSGGKGEGIAEQLQGVPPAIARPAVDPVPAAEAAIGQSFNQIPGFGGAGDALPTQEEAAASTEEIMNALQTDSNTAPEEVAAILSGNADTATVEKVKTSFMDNPGMQDLMLGMGIALLQGKDLGTAIQMGVSMQRQGISAKAAAKRQGALDEADINLKKSQTQKNLADATKAAKESGLKGEALKGYRNTFKSLVGEQPIGDDDATLRAQAQAATTELAAEPNDKALKKLQSDALQTLFSNALSIEDEDEKREAINALGRQYPKFNFKQFL